MSSSFARFARTADAVASTSSRNEKADRLAAYFDALGDEDLKRAARYFAGRLFPLSDQRTVNVGQAALLRAIARVSGSDVDDLRPRLVRLGDLGDVAEEVIADEGRDTETLATIDAWFAGLAATRGTSRKTERLIEQLQGKSTVEAKYLVKLLQADLRIGFKEGGVELALSRLYDQPIRHIQRANMLTGDLGETAVLARHGRLQSARMRLFHPIRFMLASPAEDAEDALRRLPTPFAVEDKFDGIRAQAHVARDPGDDALHGVRHHDVRVALFSRTLDAITGAFPDLVGPLADLIASDGTTDGVILDGELVPIDGDRVMPFQTLQPRLGRKRVTEETIRATPVAFVVFDVLYTDGRVLLDEPYTERRRCLEAFELPASGIRLADTRLLESADAVDTAFDEARARGNEGLMLKAPDSCYRPGRRGRDWLKLKQPLGTLDVVVTSVEVGNGRRSHLLSDFTFAVRAGEDDPTLLNVGKAYSGLTDAELEELTAWFEAHTTQSFAHGRVRLVEPEIVIEVAFDRVQPSPRHKSGYALRFPRIVRLRPDKPVSEIDTLETVRRLAEEAG